MEYEHLRNADKAVYETMLKELERINTSLELIST